MKTYRVIGRGFVPSPGAILGLTWEQANRRIARLDDCELDPPWRLEEPSAKGGRPVMSRQAHVAGLGEDALRRRRFEVIAPFELKLGEVFETQSPLPKDCVNLVQDLDSGSSEGAVELAEGVAPGVAPAEELPGEVSLDDLIREACSDLSEDEYTSLGKPKIAAVRERVGDDSLTRADIKRALGES